jgi:amino acid transporter
MLLHVSHFTLADSVPGAPFAEYLGTGPVGHFHGFAACLIQAALIIVGTPRI